MVRPRNGRLVGGVCLGLSHYLEVDVTLVRFAFLVLGLAWGLGVAAYLVLWLTVPEAGRGRAPLSDVIRTNARTIRDDMRGIPGGMARAWDQTRRTPWPRRLDRQWIAVGLIAGGTLVLLWSFGMFAWLSFTRVVGLGSIALGAAALITLGGGPR